MAVNADNYRQAGGRGTFSDYYTVEGDQAVMAPSLREHRDIYRTQPGSGRGVQRVSAYSLPSHMGNV